MALADTANLMVKLSLGGNFLSQIGKATSGLNKFDAKLGQTESRAFRAGQQIGTGIRNAGRLAAVGIGFLVSQVGLGLQSLIELEKATAQTEAVIKSTGGVAGVTAAEVNRLAEEFESLNATVGDEFIQAGANMLLTFTNIRGKAFEPALEAILNMNTALGKGPEGLTSTAIQVGKALQDPIKGVTALRRVGVMLTKAQEDQIRTLVEQNDLYGAQQVILAELNTEFGGSFLAQGNTTAGKVAKFTDAIDDLQRALAEALLPTLGNVADALSKTLADPSVVAGVKDFGKSLAGLITPANLAEAGRILQDVFGAARAAAPTIAAAAKIMGQVVGTAVSLFRSLPPEIQSLAVGAFAINKLTGGLVTNLAGGLISGVLKQLVSGVVNVRGASVIVTGGVGGAGAAAAGGSVLGRIGSLAARVFIVGAAVGIFSELIGALNEQSDRNRQQASDLTTTTKDFSKGASLADLKKSLAGIEALQRDLNEGLSPEELAFQFNIDGVRDSINLQATTLRNAIDRLVTAEEKGAAVPKSVDPKFGGRSLEERDDERTATLASILERGIAAGFKPTASAVEATLKRNESHLAGLVAAISTAGQQAAFAIRDSEKAPPIVNTYVDVNVSARGVVTQNIRNSRSGPQGGSRELSRRNSIG